MHESVKCKVKLKLLNRVRLFVTPWTAAYQAPLSMGISRQEYWSGVPLPSLSYVLLTLNVDFLPLSLVFLLVLVIRLPIVEFRDY